MTAAPAKPANSEANLQTIAKLRDSQGTVYFEVVQEPPKKTLADPAIYAPAIPGVIVALVGLWIAHRLSLRRERRKAVGELCDELEKLAEEAVEASNLGWTLAAGKDRMTAVHQTRWRTQKVGAAATRLLRQTEGPLKSGLDVISEAAHFRDTLTADPFMDPSRRANLTKLPANLGALAVFIGRLNQLRDIVLR